MKRRRSASCWAMKAAGVEFIDENGGGPGVRPRKQQQKRRMTQPAQLSGYALPGPEAPSWRAVGRSASRWRVAGSFSRWRNFG